MSEAPSSASLTYAEYLAREQRSDTKHEFLRGEAWAMAGGTPEHGRLAAALIRALGNALDGRPCVVYTSDVRVRISESDRSTYPDLSVVCGKRISAPEDPDAITNPVVLVEVLSDTTEAEDRGEKFAHYRRLASLREYVLVSQKAERIEVFRRDAEGRWTLYESGRGAAFELVSLGVSVSVDQLYRDPLAGTDGT